MSKKGMHNQKEKNAQNVKIYSMSNKCRLQFVLAVLGVFFASLNADAQQKHFNNLTCNKLGSDNSLHLYIERRLLGQALIESETFFVNKTVPIVFLYLHVTKGGIMDTVKVLNEPEKDASNSLLEDIHRMRLDTLWQNGKERSIIIPFIYIPSTVFEDTLNKDKMGKDTSVFKALFNDVLSKDKGEIDTSMTINLLRSIRRWEGKRNARMDSLILPVKYQNFKTFGSILPQNSILFTPISLLIYNRIRR